jgi:hypothetical protein
VTNDLTKLAPHVEQARLTLTQTSEHERALVQALSDELTRFDRQTLQSVRTVAAEHEARRAGILDELQVLAESIGTFRPQRESLAPQSEGLRPLAAPQPAPELAEVDYGHQYTSPGDWRQAAKNVRLEDDLEILLNGLNGRGLKN